MDLMTAEETQQLAGLKNPDAPKKEAQYEFDKSIQQDILSLMIHERSFMIQAMSLIQSNYFVDKAHVLICKILLTWFEKHVKHLTAESEQWIQEKYIRDQLSEELKDNPVKFHYIAELQTILNCYVQGLTSRSYCMERITNFAKDQAIRIAIGTTVDLLRKKSEENKYDKIKELWDRAFLVGPQMDLGLNYFKDIEERYTRMAEDRNGKDRFSSGFEDIDIKIAGNGLSRGEIGGFQAASGVGKCFAKNTEILMFDGSVKKVQDIVIGDLVMGDDSSPRKVLSTHSGYGKLFEVKPVKGKSYVVNEEHILCLKSSAKKSFKQHKSKQGDIYNISIKDYLNDSKSFRQLMKTWRTGVDFTYKKTKINPYILGVWLGDGNQDTSAFTTEDEIIADLVKNEGKKRNLNCVLYKKEDNKASTYYLYGLTRGKGCNSFVNDLRYYHLLNNKHIPHDYKTNSRQMRLELLAGLLDTDGSLTHNCYDFVNENQQLAEDVVYLCRSLGFAAYIKPCRKQCVNNGVWGDYWRVSISGDCSEIPVKISYKKASSRKQIKRVLVSGITVRELPADNWFGFSVDGNHLFLLGDFTVVHNSWMLCHAAIANFKKGHKVLHLTLEMNQDKTAERFDTLFSGHNMDELLKNKDKVIKQLSVDLKLLKIKGIIPNDDDSDRFVIKHFPAGTADVQTIKAYYSHLSLNGFKPDIVLVDYVGELKDIPNLKTYESRQRLMRDLRTFGVEENHCTLTAIQSNRFGKQKADDMAVNDDSEISDSYGQARIMDAIWSINQSKVEKKIGIGRIFVVKHRNGDSRFMCYYSQNKNNLSINSLSEEKYNDIKSSFKDLRSSDTVAEPYHGTKMKEEDWEANG